MNNELFDIIKLGMNIDFKDITGMVCNKKLYNDNLYVNIAFEEDNDITYKLFRVIYDGNNISFIEEYDEKIIEELASYWVAEEMQRTLNEAEINE